MARTRRRGARSRGSVAICARSAAGGSMLGVPGTGFAASRRAAMVSVIAVLHALERAAEPPSRTPQTRAGGCRCETEHRCGAARRQSLPVDEQEQLAIDLAESRRERPRAPRRAHCPHRRRRAPAARRGARADARGAHRPATPCRSRCARRRAARGARREGSRRAGARRRGRPPRTPRRRARRPGARRARARRRSAPSRGARSEPRRRPPRAACRGRASGESSDLLHSGHIAGEHSERHRSRQRAPRAGRRQSSR